ncbi:MAG: sulfatase [Promethearchaeota archaeon]
MAEPVNFIFIISDTLRRDFLGCYGNDWVDTRHIDAFARKSVTFDRAYSASFPTVPHRRDLLTGMLTAAYTPWARLDEWERVLPQVLGEHGYTSMMIVDNPHLLENGFNFDRGFTAFEWIRGQESDRWLTHPAKPPFVRCDPAKTRNPERQVQRHMRVAANWTCEEDRFASRTARAAARWLEQNYREHEKFFLYVDFFDPHEPWDAPQHYVDMYDPGYEGDVYSYPLYTQVEGVYTHEELQHARALYAAEVTLVDRWVGFLLQRIEDLGLFENTVVFFSTDHGFLHGEHGVLGKSLIDRDRMAYLPLYEEINHVPLLVRAPDQRARRTDAIVQPMDLMGTVLDYAGITSEPWVQGLSFRPVLDGRVDRLREFAISTPFVRSAGAAATVVKENWAAVLYSRKRLKGSDKAVDGFDKRVEAAAGGHDALYDVTKDPRQEKDVAPDHPDLVAEMRALLVEVLEDLVPGEEYLEGWR